MSKDKSKDSKKDKKSKKSKKDDLKAQQKEDFKKTKLPEPDEAAQEQARAQAPGNAFPATVKAHYIKDLSIENPHSPYSIAPGMDKPKVNINFGLDYRKLDFEGQDNNYEILVAVNVTAERKSHTAFIIELHYGIVTETLEGLPADKLEPFLLTEIPRYAFPFIRQIIASATAEAGFMPLYLSPVNFVHLYKQKLAAQAAGKEAKSGAAS